MPSLSTIYRHITPKATHDFRAPPFFTMFFLPRIPFNIRWSSRIVYPIFIWHLVRKTLRVTLNYSRQQFALCGTPHNNSLKIYTCLMLWILWTLWIKVFMCRVVLEIAKCFILNYLKLKIPYYLIKLSPHITHTKSRLKKLLLFKVS